MNDRIVVILIAILFFSAAACAADECGECHTLEAESFFLTQHSKDWNCRSCHGAGEKHLMHADADDIVSPGSMGQREGNSICLLCHEDKAKDIQERFTAVTNLHDDIRCYECHVVHLTASDGEKDISTFAEDMSVDCNKCHMDKQDRVSNSAHGASGLKCYDCHKTHESKTISQDIEAEIDLCFYCHPSQKLEFKNPFVHPLRERQIGCGDCHDPHGTGNDNMLKEDGDRVCEKCHTDIRIAGGRHPESRGTKHPFKTVKCMDCHEPHGSMYDKVLKYDENRICTTCHN